MICSNLKKKKIFRIDDVINDVIGVGKLSKKYLKSSMEERLNHHFWHFEISQFLTFEDWYSHQYHKLLGSKRSITNLIHFCDWKDIDIP